MKKIISMLIVCMIMVAASGCTSSKAELEKTQADFTRVETADNCSLWSEYNGLNNVYKYDAEYTEDEWVDKEGNILFPYEDSIADCKDIKDNLSKLKMPDSLVNTASTKDLLRIVTEGWITDTIGNAFAYETAEEYINYSTSANQAANELFLRSDMVEVVLNDYVSASYDKDTDTDTALHYSSVLRFDEILLASDYAYDKMDDKTKGEVLNAVVDKINNTDDEVYYGCKCECGFFSYIHEQDEKGGSKWKTYIEENGSEKAKEFLENKTNFVNAEYY